MRAPQYRFERPEAPTERNALVSPYLQGWRSSESAEHYKNLAASQVTVGLGVIFQGVEVRQGRDAERMIEKVSNAVYAALL